MKTIKENNRMIAEFMGGKTKKTVLVTIGERMTEKETWLPFHGIVELNRLKYHTSWDWLMPVVDKIQRMDGSKELNEKIDLLCILPIYTEIERVYQAVVQFIEWYNENK